MKPLPRTESISWYIEPCEWILIWNLNLEMCLISFCKNLLKLPFTRHRPNCDTCVTLVWHLCDACVTLVWRLCVTAITLGPINYPAAAYPTPSLRLKYLLITKMWHNFTPNEAFLWLLFRRHWDLRRYLRESLLYLLAVTAAGCSQVSVGVTSAPGVMFLVTALSLTEAVRAQLSLLIGVCEILPYNDVYIKLDPQKSLYAVLSEYIVFSSIVFYGWQTCFQLNLWISACDHQYNIQHNSSLLYVNRLSLIDAENGSKL